ncbi:MAG: UvrD-helicase domain-containing protein [Bacillales bacterium]|nr:UvrD-helicase domain-containing protein [Bacillales bacterium]
MVKRFFFAPFDDTEVLMKNDLLAKALTKGVLRLSTVRYSDEWENKRFAFQDGEVEDLKFFDFLDENSSFNKEQYILEHKKGNEHCLVKAGAGTGKTTTMISRIMFLKHMNPNLHLKEVVMITFTNEAATQLREKFMEPLKNYYELTKNKKYLEWMEEAGDMFIATPLATLEISLIKLRTTVLSIGESIQNKSCKYRYHHMI